MNLTISDDLEPEKRRVLLKILPIVYALNKFRRKEDAAVFLDMSVRGMRNIIKKYPIAIKYLEELERAPSLKVKKRVKSEGYLEMNRRYPDK